MFKCRLYMGNALSCVIITVDIACHHKTRRRVRATNRRENYDADGRGNRRDRKEINSSSRMPCSRRGMRRKR